MTTISDLEKIMYYIAGYLSEEHGCSYGKLIELFRENISGLENLKYSDIYPILFNVTAKQDIDDENVYFITFDCDSVAKQLFGEE